jgi:predicted DCC family thiol-disulfide oxidoreductase YuxK
MSEKKENPQKKQKIEILYDGDCPFCSRYVQWLRLKERFDVTLINARAESPLKKHATDLSMNLDRGMVVFYAEKLYWGPEAMTLLTELSKNTGLFNRLMVFLFSAPKRSKIFYPAFAFMRWVAVLVMAKGEINNLK